MTGTNGTGAQMTELSNRVTVVLTDDQLKKLDLEAKKQQRPRGYLIREYVVAGLLGTRKKRPKS